MDKLQKVIEQTLGRRFEKGEEKKDIDDLRGVDSFEVLLVLTEVEKEFKINIPMEQATKINTLEDYRKKLKEMNCNNPEIKVEKREKKGTYKVDETNPLMCRRCGKQFMWEDRICEYCGIELTPHWI